MSESLFPTRWANDKPPSLEKFTSDFADDYACAEYLAKKRWKSGIRCPRCGGNRAWRLEARPWVWECQGVVVDDDGTRTATGCRYQTSLIAGTVMHGTHLPLRIWFLAAYLLATHSNGMSALQLQPKLGLSSYKAACFYSTSSGGQWSIPTGVRFAASSRSTRPTCRSAARTNQTVAVRGEASSARFAATDDGSRGAPRCLPDVLVKKEIRGGMFTRQASIWKTSKWDFSATFQSAQS